MLLLCNLEEKYTKEKENIEMYKYHSEGEIKDVEKDKESRTYHSEGEIIKKVKNNGDLSDKDYYELIVFRIISFGIIPLFPF